MSVINWNILYLPDPDKGRPLFSGQIYVGEPDLDPEDGNGNPINSKQLNVIQEDGTVVPVNQPFILSAGGVPQYNGAPVRLDVAGNYSIKILNKLGAQTYYIENVYEGQPVTVETLPGLLINDLSQAYEFATVAEYKAFATAFPVGKVVNLLDRGAEFTVIAGTGTANIHSIIDSTEVDQSITIAEANPTASQLGIIGDGSTDQSAGLAILDSLFGVIDVANIFIDSDMELTNIATFRGGYLKPANTRTITINDIDTPCQQIFSVALGGAFILNKKYAKATWFGALAGLGDNGVIFNAAINACGRTGTVEVQTIDINLRYNLTVGIVCDYDEFTFRGEQFRTRIGTDLDITVFTQNIRAPSPYFGLHLQNLDFFNNVVSGTSNVVDLNASFLFILDNVYIDKGPANGFQFIGICAQGVIQNCVAEELQGTGFNETSGSVMLSYSNCQSFANGNRGFSSGNNTATYGNSLVGCKAYLNGVNNFNRGDAGVSIASCMSRNAGAVGIVLGSSAHNASVKGTPSFDDRGGSAVQTYGYETNHYSQYIDPPTGYGNVIGIVLNNEASALLTIASGAITLPQDLPPGATVRVDTEGAIPSDKLENISRGYTDQIIIIKAADDARDIVISDEFNNIAGAGDFTMDHSKDRYIVQYDRTSNRWVELSRSNNN